MQVSHYIAAFWAGAFLANFVPHFVHGSSGNKFPTPFSKPPGIGLSTSTTNVIWALFNLACGYLLFNICPVDMAHPGLLITFFAGITVLSIYASFRFRRKHKE